MTQSDSTPQPLKVAKSSPLGDMLRSVVVLLVIVVGLVLGGKALFGQADDPQPTIDYLTAAQQARRVAPFDLLAPRSLPNGWHVSSVKYEAGAKPHWHLGVLTQDKDYVGLEQTPLSPAKTRELYAPATHPAGRTTIDGQWWKVRTSKAGETTLVRRSGGTTTLVTGTASRTSLEKYVTSLTSGP